MNIDMSKNQVMWEIITIYCWHVFLTIRSNGNLRFKKGITLGEVTSGVT